MSPPPAHVTPVAVGTGGGPELDQLLAAAAEERAVGRGVVLATVVDRRGSSYRRPGARLVVREDSSSVGLVSGGCLESEVVERAREVASTGRARVVTFDLTADEEAIWGWGLGCNGAIDVLLQPRERSHAVLDVLARVRSTRRRHVLALVLSGPRAGAHLLVGDDGIVDGDLGDATADVTAAARARLGTDAPVRCEVAGMDVFLEPRRPPLELLVCGAGPDVDPLVRLARELGWVVTVADDRRVRFPVGRFPDDVRTVVVDPAGLPEVVELDGRTHVVIMSHDFLRDAGYLATLAATDVAYVGLLGPARRRQRLISHLDEAGTSFTPGQLARIHGPAGLDLGSEGPVEIAWSICSQVLAVSRGRPAGHLAGGDPTGSAR